MSNHLTKSGLQLIKDCEGCKLKAYPDPATGAEPWTIGYGHTGPEVKKGMVINLYVAEELLQKDLFKFCTQVTALCASIKLTDNQYSALVSLVYNIGPENFKKSTLLKLLLKSEFDAASQEFIKWDKAAGKEMTGLTKRRQMEANLFNSKD